MRRGPGPDAVRPGQPWSGPKCPDGHLAGRRGRCAPGSSHEEIVGGAAGAALVPPRAGWMVVINLEIATCSVEATSPYKRPSR